MTQEQLIRKTEKTELTDYIDGGKYVPLTKAIMDRFGKDQLGLTMAALEIGRLIGQEEAQLTEN